MASKKKTDQTVRMASPDMLKQIWAIVMQALPTRLTWEQAQYWIGHGRELAVKVRAIFTVVDPYHDRIRIWEKFYQDVLGLTVDFSMVATPLKRNGFDRLVIVPQGLTIEQVLTACKKYFKIHRWADKNLDKLVDTNDRTSANGAYAIWLRDCQEPDQEHASKSANDLKVASIQCVTLTEELVNHLEYFVRTGQHLSISNWTLCPGSRYSDGSVPYVSWYAYYGELYVGWYIPDYRRGSLRAREVVS